jgi:hypothetical protein
MNQPPEVTKAIQLYKQNQPAESRQILRDYFATQPGNVEALLWLAKVTSDSREAIAAAELALALEPDNEIARRAVASVSAKPDLEQNAELAIDVMRVTGMTLAQARAVKWPFNGPLKTKRSGAATSNRRRAHCCSRAYWAINSKSRHSP